MDKRFKPQDIAAQVEAREQMVQDVLSNPALTPAQVVRQIRQTLRFTVAEYAKLAKVSPRTVQDIENGHTSGTVLTLNKLLGLMGMRLGVQKNSTHQKTD